MSNNSQGGPRGSGLPAIFISNILSFYNAYTLQFLCYVIDTMCLPFLTKQVTLASLNFNLNYKNWVCLNDTAKNQVIYITQKQGKN